MSLSLLLILCAISCGLKISSRKKTTGILLLEDSAESVLHRHHYVNQRQNAYSSLADNSKLIQVGRSRTELMKKSMKRKGFSRHEILNKTIQNRSKSTNDIKKILGLKVMSSRSNRTNRRGTSLTRGTIVNKNTSKKRKKFSKKIISIATRSKAKIKPGLAFLSLGTIKSKSKKVNVKRKTPRGLNTGSIKGRSRNPQSRKNNYRHIKHRNTVKLHRPKTPNTVMRPIARSKIYPTLPSVWEYSKYRVQPNSTLFKGFNARSKSSTLFKGFNTRSKLSSGRRGKVIPNRINMDTDLVRKSNRLNPKPVLRPKSLKPSYENVLKLLEPGCSISDVSIPIFLMLVK